jgi:RNA-directed DNA polymerase
MSDAAELKLNLYRKAEALADVAKILDFLPAHLSYAIYKLPSAIRYKEFSVPKKSGGVRIIRAPHKTLKVIQKRLAQDLSTIEAHLEAKRVKKRDCVLAHGFKKSFSIMTNGENHRRRRYVLNIDLKDFFPSINFGRVYGFFLKNKSFELKPKVAAVSRRLLAMKTSFRKAARARRSSLISSLALSISGSTNWRRNTTAPTHGTPTISRSRLASIYFQLLSRNEHPAVSICGKPPPPIESSQACRFCTKPI